MPISPWKCISYTQWREPGELPIWKFYWEQTVSTPQVGELRWVQLRQPCDIPADGRMWLLFCPGSIRDSGRWPMAMDSSGLVDCQIIQIDITSDPGKLANRFRGQLDAIEVWGEKSNPQLPRQESHTGPQDWALVRCHQFVPLHKIPWVFPKQIEVLDKQLDGHHLHWESEREDDAEKLSRFRWESEWLMYFHVSDSEGGWGESWLVTRTGFPRILMYSEECGPGVETYILSQPCDPEKWLEDYPLPQSSQS